MPIDFHHLSKGHFVIIQIPCVALNVDRYLSASTRDINSGVNVAKGCHALCLDVFMLCLCICLDEMNLLRMDVHQNNNEIFLKMYIVTDKCFVFPIRSVNVACDVCCLLLLSLSLCGAPRTQPLSIFHFYFLPTSSTCHLPLHYQLSHSPQHN